MGNRAEVWHDSVILLRTVMTHQISRIVQRSTAVAGWFKLGQLPGAEVSCPLDPGSPLLPGGTPRASQGGISSLCLCLYPTILLRGRLELSQCNTTSCNTAW